MEKIEDQEKWKCIIFFDSIDQLSPEDGAFLMKWLPRPIRSCFRIIISALPDEKYGILRNLRVCFLSFFILLSCFVFFIDNAEKLIFYGHIYLKKRFRNKIDLFSRIVKMENVLGFTLNLRKFLFDAFKEITTN